MFPTSARYEPQINRSSLVPLQSCSFALRSPRSAPRRLLSPLRAPLCSTLRQPSVALPLRPFVVLRPRTSLLPFTFCPSSHVPAARLVILYHFPSQPQFSKSPMFPYAAPRNTQQPFCAPRAQHQTCLPPAPSPSSSAPRSPRLKSSLSSSSAPRSLPQPACIRPSPRPILLHRS